MEENKNVGSTPEEKKIKINPANVIIRTAMIHQISAGLQNICDAVSILLQGDFTCKECLEGMSEYAEEMFEMFSGFLIKNELSLS